MSGIVALLLNHGFHRPPFSTVFTCSRVSTDGYLPTQTLYLSQVAPHH